MALREAHSSPRTCPATREGHRAARLFIAGNGCEAFQHSAIDGPSGSSFFSPHLSRYPGGPSGSPVIYSREWL